MLPLTALLGCQLIWAELLVTAAATRPWGGGGGVCVVTTFRSAEGALRYPSESRVRTLNV